MAMFYMKLMEQCTLINLYIYDNNHEEIFKMTKEIGQVLTKYKFYDKGEPVTVCWRNSLSLSDIKC